ncbi:MAG: FkbM family methyltransferase [Gammaproteobacteria bacterium]
MSLFAVKIRKIREKISKKIQKLKHTKLINRNTAMIRQIVVSMHNDELKKSARYQDPKHLIRFGEKIYSQNEEDGIIKEIFNRIGVTNKIFVEFGIGDGLENNTLALLLSDWKGLWMDGSTRSINNIKDHFKCVINNNRLKALEIFVTKENINELISTNIDEKEIDLLSIDIDGNDATIFKAITAISARVVVIEYNSKFPPPVKFSVDYDPTHNWQGDDYMGASISYLEDCFNEKGYKLVGCDLLGTNAFFVRDDLVGDKFLQPYTAEHHYEPARYHLVGRISGHSPTYKSIEKILNSCQKIHNQNS